MIRSLVGLVICCVLTAQCSLTPTTYLNEQDKERLRGLLQLNSPFSDVPSSSLYYSLSGQQILTNGRLGSVYSAQQISQICDVLKKNLEDQKASQIVENAYFTILAGNLLNCQVTMPQSLRRFAILMILNLHLIAVSRPDRRLTNCISFVILYFISGSDAWKCS